MTEISFVIPMHHPETDQNETTAHRNMIASWSMGRLHQHWSNIAEVIQGYPNAPNEPFNRGQAANNGFRQARGEYVFIVDSDTVFNPLLVENALSQLRLLGAPWVIPYSRYLRTNEVSGLKLLASDYRSNLEEQDYKYDHVITYPPTEGYQAPVSGVICFRSKDYHAIGGFNENFRGWGYEDRGIVLVADVLLGEHHRTSDTVWHIWHPESVTATWQQAHIQENASLADRMSALRHDPVALWQLNNDG